MVDKRSLRASLISGGVWSFTGKVVTMLAGLASSALLARLLTPDDMGVYFLIVSFVSIAVIVAQFGLKQTIVRLVAEAVEKDDYALAKGAVMKALLVGGAATLCVGLLTAGPLGLWVSETILGSPVMADVLGLMAIWVLIFTVRGLSVEVFRGVKNFRVATIFGDGLTRTLTAIAFAAAYVSLGTVSLSSAVTLAIVSASISAAFILFLLSRKLKEWPAPKKVSLFEILKVSLPLFVTATTFFVITQIDLWVLGMYTDKGDVAIYGAAARVVALVIMPLQIINLVLPPFIAQLNSQQEKHTLEKLIRVAATLGVIPSIAALILFVAFGDSLLGLLYGDHYRAASTILAILSVAQLINAAAGSCGLVLIMTGHQSDMMRITIFTGVLVLATTVIAAREYGVVAVAIVMATGMAVQNILMLLTARIRVGVWTHFSYQHFRPKNIKLLFNTGR